MECRGSRETEGEGEGRAEGEGREECGGTAGPLPSILTSTSPSFPLKPQPSNLAVALEPSFRYIAGVQS